jgi:hypothetical protein
MQRGRIPVNVEMLAVRSGHPVHLIDRLREKYDLKGTVFKVVPEGRLEILVDARHYEQDTLSSPFTIAEELGHILVHTEFFEGVNSPEDRIAFENEMNEQTHRLFEMQAKKVASALLLPSGLFDPLVHEWCKENIGAIRKDNPIDENDLGEFIARNLSPRIGLSIPIVKRAMNRKTPTTLIEKLIGDFEIKLLRNLPNKS